MSYWDETVKRLWASAASKVGYGVWTVTPTIDEPAKVETGNGEIQLSASALYAVRNASGVVVALTGYYPVAQLLAQVPDLCEPSYRPADSSGGVGVETDNDAERRTLHTAHAEGYAEGRADGYDEAVEDIGQAALDAATEARDEVESSLVKDGIIEDPDIDGGLLG